MGKAKRLDATVLTVAVIGSLVLLNLLGVGFFGRADLTRDGQFTISQATKDTLSGLSDPVTVRAYFSRDLPPPLSSTARYVHDLLDEYYAYGDGNFRYEFIDPASEETAADKEKKKEVKRDIFGRLMREKTSVERELEGLGIRPVEVRVNQGDKLEAKRVYMGLAVTYGNKKEAIPLVQKTADLEYDLTTLIRKVSRSQAPKVALIGGHQGPDPRTDMKAVWDLMGKRYDVTTLDLTQKVQIPDDVDAILVIGPRTPFSEDEQRAIDRFVASGRSAAFLLGPVAPDLKTLQPNPTAHGLAGLLASYGVTLDPALVLDTSCASVPIERQQGPMHITQQVRYPFIPILKELSKDSPLTRGLSYVAFPFAAPLEPVDPAPTGVKVEVLARTTPNAWLMKGSYNLDPLHRWTRDEVGQQAPRDLLISLSGSIPAHFPGDGPAEGQTPAQGGRVLVSGSHAFLLDRFLSKGNQALVLNLMDWLVQDEALLAVRSRGLDMAPLEEISDGARNGLKYANVIGLPLLFIGFGLIRWRLRESRRRKVTCPGSGGAA